MPERPAQRRKRVDELEGRSVFRDGMSPESYQQLKNAETVSELKAVLIDVFEPSSSE